MSTSTQHHSIADQPRTAALRPEALDVCFLFSGVLPTLILLPWKKILRVV
jgi:hypothetical protein